MRKSEEHLSQAAADTSHHSDSLAATLECLGSALIVTDVNGRIEFMNGEAERLTGVERPLAERRLLHQCFQLREKFGGPVTTDLVRLAIVSGGTVSLGTNVVIVPQNGDPPREADGEVSVRRSSGQIDGAILTFRDVTVRNREESQRREQEKVRAVSELAGSIAHTLNNQLMIILHHGETLTGPCPIDAVQAAGAEIVNAGGEIRKLTADLVKLAGTLRVHPSVLDVNRVVSEVMHEDRDLFDGNAVNLTLSPAPAVVLMDRDQLKSVVLSMLRYLRNLASGQGELEVATGILMVDENSRGEYLRRYVQLTVADRALQMSDAELETSLQPVLDPSVAAGSSGMHLFTVRTAAAMVRGHFGIERDARGGTSLALTIPCFDEPAGERAPASAQSAQGAATVLLVEDDNAVRTLLRNSLEKHGYGVIEARDGAEALEQAAWHDGAIDLLVTDIMMPRLNGVQLAMMLDERQPGLKVLFISGGTEQVSGCRDLFVKGAQFLSKPFCHTDLISSVRSILSSS